MVSKPLSIKIRAEGTSCAGAFGQLYVIQGGAAFVTRRTRALLVQPRQGIKSKKPYVILC